MGRRIFIAEDNPHLVKIAITKLERAGYEVEIKGTGPTALAAILANPPDLAILDVMMPAMTGFEVLAKLRANPKTEKLPVIMLTSLKESFDKEKAKGLNVVDYMVKPYRPADLLSKVEKLVPKA